MLKLIGIDPGPERSGLVIATQPYRDALPDILTADGSARNELVLSAIRSSGAVVVCETLSEIRQSVGADVFQTAYWIGEFRGAARENVWEPVEARHVKRALLGTVTGKQSLVRAEIIKRYAHGIEDKKKAQKLAVGTATRPGPLFGVSDHAWMALACMIAYLDRKETKNVVTA